MKAIKVLTRLFLTSSFTLVTLCCNAQQFTLSGQIKGLKDMHIYIRYTDADGTKQKDSCITADGNYKFNGRINEPTRIYLAVFPGTFKWVDDSEPNVTNVYVEPGNNTANGDYLQLKKIEVTGSKTQMEASEFNKKFTDLNQRSATFKERYQQLLKQYNEEKKKTPSNQRIIDTLNKQMTAAKQVLDGFAEQYLPITLQFITANPSSYISAEHLNIHKTKIKLDQLKLLYSKLIPKVQQSNSGKEIAAFVSDMEQNTVGKMAKDFSGKGPDGKIIKLSDYRGKYVLLDFWGSWCVPCRVGVPHLKTLFNKYRPLGLEVVAIAVDDKTDAWINAIKTDGTGLWANLMDEPSMSNGKENVNAIHKQYSVHLFPTKLLIDQKGVIVARYDGSDSAGNLDKKLADLFGK